MFKKSSIKGFIVGSICTAILVTGVSSFATGSMLKNISVAYENIKVAVDGERVDLKDSRGETVEPFIHDGTTYLPVRALGEILGKEVDWDGKTKTVHLGENLNQAQYLTEQLKGISNGGKSYNLEDEEKMEMGGKTYTTGFEVRRGFSNRYVYFYLDENYTEITGEVGAVSLQGRNDLNIYLDEKLYKTIEISGDKSPEKITIPVSGVSEVKFSIDSIHGDQYGFGLGDFKIK